MSRLHLLSLVFAALLICCAVAPASAQGSAQSVIVVSGEGVATEVPDIATIRLGVTTQDVAAGTALADNSARMEAVMAQLTERGIEPRDLQTSGFSVQPVYERREDGTGSEIIGYSVRNMVTVRVRELDGLGSLLDAVVTDGANTLQGLSFGLADPAAQKTQAEAAAVADALARAEDMAAAADLSLGPILRIEAVTGPTPRPQMEMAARAADAAAVPVAGGEMAIRAQVTVTIALVE